MFVKSTRFKQVCQLLLSLIVVTSNYCTCDLWTTLLLGGKTFPIIEAFFFFGFEFRPHSIVPVTWNQYNIYSHTSSTYHSVQGHR